MSDRCPQCNEEYEKKVSLSNRHGKKIDMSDAESMCQVAEKRTGGGPVAGHKSTRSDSEKYKFVGYIHE